MTRDMVKTLRTQAQLFRQMKNPAQGDILDRAAPILKLTRWWGRDDRFSRIRLLP
jgi:hypothetical protein